MKQGSVVHKILEEQVYQTVPVDVQTKEDHWGLKLWNVIQGLRTLRTTGMTRELEIWGMVDGVVVNGVIDELSYTCMDPELEARVVAAEAKLHPEKSLPADQPAISTFFKTNGKSSDKTPSQGKPDAARMVYVTDVKTRVKPVLPKGASLRPTYMQLMLYRQLLVDLASNNVQSDLLFARYSLDPTQPFSDSLIAQLASLDLNLSQSSTEYTYAPVESSQDAVEELLTHNGLAKLWTLVIREFQLTFPHGDASVGKVLRAEFRSQRDGAVLGAKSFVHDGGLLHRYVRDEMDWWRGGREARGVEIEEAFKCQSCEFASTLR